VARERNVAIHIRAYDEATKVFEGIAKNTLPQFAKRVAQSLAGFASIAAVEEVVRRSITNAMDAEKATAALTAALNSQKLSVQANLPHLTAFAGALSRASLATDEEVQGAQQLLISIGRLTGEGLDRATKAALNLSAGLGISLSDAAEKIARAANGATKGFSQLGVKFQEGASDAEKLNTVLSFIDQRFGGAAQAQIETMSGKLHELAKAFGELGEAAGKSAIGTGPKGLIGTLTDAINAMADKTSKGGLFSALHTIIPVPGDPIWTSVNKIITLGETLERLKMDDAVMLALSGKFAEDADPILQKYIKDLDGIIKAQDDAADATKRHAEAVAKFNANTGVQTFGPQKASSRPSVIGAVQTRILGDEVNRAQSDVGSTEELEKHRAAVAAEAAEWEKMVEIIAEANGGMVKFGETVVLVGKETTKWSTQFELTMRDALTSAALQLGDTLVEAAFGAKVSWEDTIKSIVEGIVKAIIQAAILRLIQGAIGGFSTGGVVGSSSGGIGPRAYADGGMVYAAGGFFRPRGTDTVPAMLTPGEIVLPRGVSQSILGGRASVVPAGMGGGSPQIVTVNIGGATLTRLLVDNARSVVTVLDHIDARGM